MEVLLTSVIAFISTNLDDIFILTLLFNTRKFKERNILAGQYIGIGALTAVGFAGSFIGLFLLPEYIGFLGLIPLYLGIKAALNLRNSDSEADVTELNTGSSRKGYQEILYVASITIANGGDNIGIYIPLFATLTLAGKTIMTIVFMIMTAIWCMIAKYLTQHPLIKKGMEKYGHIVTPFIFIFLGIYILYESGTLNLLKSFSL